MNRSDSGREKIETLLRIYAEGKISREEEQELFDLIDIDEDEDIIRKQIDNIIAEQMIGQDTPEVNWETLYQRVEERRYEVAVDSKVRKMFPWKWVAAAVVTLLLGTGYYFWTIQTPGNWAEMVISAEEPSEAIDIAPPSSTAAVLTLANGQVVILDSAGNGTIVQQGTVDIVKLADGQITYRGSGQNAGYNTLSNPRGSKVIDLKLADGTRIWLNAASTLRYPVAFTGKERKVEISGEAYFEVARDPAKPFIVSKGATEIKVLGTHFNVEAYDDESSLDVTLVEGSVSVTTIENIARPKVIKPGEQAKVMESGTITLTKSVNLNEVTAWKDNIFSFDGASIETIMRQVSRWYDVEVIFKQPVKEKFYAEVSKNTNVSTLLKMLEATNAVHFKMEGDLIVVTP